ncbi:3281_t:CDS:2, partial [Dentiscutata heterogama]
CVLEVGRREIGDSKIGRKGLGWVTDCVNYFVHPFQVEVQFVGGCFIVYPLRL